MRPPCFTAVYGAVGMTIVGMSVGLTAVLTGELESEGSQAGVALSSQAVRTIVSSAASHAPHRTHRGQSSLPRQSYDDRDGTAVRVLPSCVFCTHTETFL